MLFNNFEIKPLHLSLNIYDIVIPNILKHIKLWEVYNAFDFLLKELSCIVSIPTIPYDHDRQLVLGYIPFLYIKFTPYNDLDYGIKSIITKDKYENIRTRIKIINIPMLRDIYSTRLATIRTCSELIIGDGKYQDETLINITLYPIYKKLYKDDYIKSIGLPNNSASYRYHDRITKSIDCNELMIINSDVSPYAKSVTITINELLNDDIITKLLVYEYMGGSVDTVILLGKVFDNKSLKFIKLYYSKKTHRLYGVY